MPVFPGIPGRRILPSNAVYLEPAKVTLTRVLSTAFGTSTETKRVLFNPSSLKVAIEANYKTQEIPGLATHRVQYVSTRNPRVPIQLFFDQVEHNRQGINQVQGPIPGSALILSLPILTNFDFLSAEDFQNFLISLMYPGNVGGTARRESPPRLIFSWPNFINLTGVVRKLDFQYIHWGPFGSILRLQANLELEVLLSSDKATTTNTRFFGYKMAPIAGLNGTGSV